MLGEPVSVANCTAAPTPLPSASKNRAPVAERLSLCVEVPLRSQEGSIAPAGAQRRSAWIRLAFGFGRAGPRGDGTTPREICLSFGCAGNDPHAFAGDAKEKWQLAHLIKKSRRPGSLRLIR